jgi:hypothetical protein
MNWSTLLKSRIEGEREREGKRINLSMKKILTLESVINIVVEFNDHNFFAMHHQIFDNTYQFLHSSLDFLTLNTCTHPYEEDIKKRHFCSKQIKSCYICIQICKEKVPFSVGFVIINLSDDS